MLSPVPRDVLSWFRGLLELVVCIFVWVSDGGGGPVRCCCALTSDSLDVAGEHPEDFYWFACLVPQSGSAVCSVLH